MRFEGRGVLVTGGGSGIGRSTCLRVAAEGARVAVVDLRAERAQETAQEIAASGGRAIALTADVSKSASVDNMAASAIDAFGPIDTLVNNAGIAAGDDILTFDESTWDLNLSVVLKSVFLVSRALLPAMIEAGSGTIVNVSSVNGLTGIGEEAYSAAKAGMINLTQNMAIKYGPRGVRVNVVCPGTVRTPIWDGVVADKPQIFDELTRWYPLGRVGEPEDIAAAILFLASSDASWITGQTLTVDGGLTAGNPKLLEDVDIDAGFPDAANQKEGL